MEAHGLRKPAGGRPIRFGGLLGPYSKSRMPLWLVFSWIPLALALAFLTLLRFYSTGASAPLPFDPVEPLLDLGLSAGIPQGYSYEAGAEDGAFSASSDGPMVVAEVCTQYWYTMNDRTQ